MRVLFDTTVVLDVLLNRAPHAAADSRLVAGVELGRIQGFLGAPAVRNSLSGHGAVGAASARRHVQALLSLFAAAAVRKSVLTHALSVAFRHYEDAVLHEAAGMQAPRAS